MEVTEFLKHPSHNIRIIKRIRNKEGEITGKKYVLYDESVLRDMENNPDNYEFEQAQTFGRGAFFG